MTKPKFSPGDALRVCKKPTINNKGANWMEEMTSFIGKEVEFDKSGYYNGEWIYRTWIKGDRTRCFWFNENWLEPIPKNRGCYIFSRVLQITDIGTTSESRRENPDDKTKIQSGRTPPSL